MAAMSVAESRALRRAFPATLDWLAQISAGLCSTQPGFGKIWRNSSWAMLRTFPPWSKTMARELVVPWSSARMYFMISEESDGWEIQAFVEEADYQIHL